MSEIFILSSGARIEVTDQSAPDLPQEVRDIIAARSTPSDDDVLAAYDAALTAHLDSVAQSRRWENRITCAVRAAYPNQWQQEAIAFGTWMDACNVHGYQVIAAVKSGQMPLPTVEAFIASLPAMVWPE